MLTTRKFHPSENRAANNHRRIITSARCFTTERRATECKVDLAGSDRIFPRNWTERTLEHVARSRGMSGMHGMSRSDSLLLAGALDFSTNDLYRSRRISHSRTPHALHSITINPNTLVTMTIVVRTISHLSLSFAIRSGTAGNDESKSETK